VNRSAPEDLSQFSMLELFRVEVENQTAVLTKGLLEVERGEAPPQLLEQLMRAAHSLKGGARIINLQGAVRVAHALEDCFVAAQQGRLVLRQSEIDILFRGVDLLGSLAQRTDSNLSAWESDHATAMAEFLDLLQKLMSPGTAPQPLTAASTQARPTELPPAADAEPVPAPEVVAEAPTPPSHPVKVQPAPVTTDQADAIAKPEEPDRVLRLTAENLNRLLGLAGESLVESRWLRPFSDSLQRLRRQQAALRDDLEHLRQALAEENLSERTKGRFNETFRKAAEAHQGLTERVLELDMFDRRSAHLSHRLYLEVLRTRMRPFSDGVGRFPRMVRDLARSLGKQVTLELGGENTPVDRDILDHLEAPLTHLLRNAVDHGCEMPEVRQRAGKPAEATIRLEARHSAGTLLVTVSDDGAGVPLERVRKAILQRRLTPPALAEKLSDSELLQFLFLPGFSLKENVTELSGRGVGLDVVQNMVKSVRGTIRILNQPGRGLRFQLQLPLTLSVLRALLVEVAGEPYALPLTQITRTLKLPRAKIEPLEGRPHFRLGEQQIGLLTAHQVLDCGPAQLSTEELPVVVVGERQAQYGLVVDRFLGERELVVQPLDPRLGQLKEISSAALMEDGTPVLIVNVEDLLHSVETLLAGGSLAGVQPEMLGPGPRKLKRVLAVDDSLTVRELFRKLLTSRGYHAEVAVDGMEAWNAVRTRQYDLVVTDVDMPRMNGIELTSLIKQDAALKGVPVLIVSYKDREEDRMRGLEAGADYYLTKGSFHDAALLEAVVDLIGEPEA
jgi:two-component system, chemotaxis family, sensor histidine kinase and response regulator WspE